MQAVRPRELEDSLNFHIYHPLAWRLAQGLARTPLTPNVVSVIGAGFVVAAAVAYSQPWWPISALLGMMLHMTWHVIDGADGDLARITGRASPIGEMVDGICDYTGHIMLYLVLGWLLSLQIGLSAWPLIVAGGISHIIQSNHVEVQRRSYQWWVYAKPWLRITHAQADAATQGQGFSGFASFYLGVAAGVASSTQRIDNAVAAAANDPERLAQIRQLARAEARPLLDLLKILGPNPRTIVLGLSMLAGSPIYYFVYQVVVLNALLIWSVHRHNAAARRMLAAIGNWPEPEHAQEHLPAGADRRILYRWLKPKLLIRAEALSGELTALRRAVHADPELGLHTPRTRDKIRAALADLPLTWREGPSTTGLVAVLQGTAAGPADAGPRRVLLRGDMDALPMPEETGLPFASTTPGAMHACGHDAHVAMLVGATRLLCVRADRFVGEVQLMFQPGEEGYHGARYMLDDGLIDPLPDAAFALHIMPNARHGVVAGRSGALLAAADMIDITIDGRGGHASMPHQTRDPVPVACEIVMGLQALVTRQFDAHDPVVVTITRIVGGTAHNVIADHVKLSGTMRTLSAGNRERLRQAIERLATGIAAAYGLAAQVTITPGFPVTICDARAVDCGEAVAGELFGADAFQRLSAPIMGAEDFAYVLEKTPGAMFFLGAAADGADWSACCGIHSTRMMLDEGVLPRGAALLAGLAERFLARGFG